MSCSNVIFNIHVCFFISMNIITWSPILSDVFIIAISSQLFWTFFTFLTISIWKCILTNRIFKCTYILCQIKSIHSIFNLLIIYFREDYGLQPSSLTDLSSGMSFEQVTLNQLNSDLGHDLQRSLSGRHAALRWKTYNCTIWLQTNVIFLSIFELVCFGRHFTHWF